MIRRTLVVVVAATCSLAAAEIALRILDGFVVFSLVLTKSSSHRQSEARPDLRHFRDVALAPGVNQSWYALEPPPIPRIPMDSATRARVARYPNDPYGAFFAWNPEFLKSQLCAGNTTGSLGILSDFYVYHPVEAGPYPTYRHLPRISPPGWFVTNSFGWRGPDLALERPPNAIRIAFVGASTTVSPYGIPLSHPEFIGYWLNLWAASQGLPLKFEVINAGRTGIDSSSISAIVRQELLPVDPDFVVYYEGANQFAPGKAMRMPPTLAAKPTITFRKRTAAEDYSAFVQRVLTALSLFTGGQGAEPPKPSYPTIWPHEVDEGNPDVTRVPLPMDLHEVVANLDAMRTALSDIGSELAVSSFIWMVYPRMRLDLSRHLTLYRFLNDTYWPASYAHLRRMADFQNRVFANYARAHDLVFLDIANDFPRDADLFGDAIHMTQDGLRLQAWTYLQELIPLVKARIASGRWPRPVRRATSWNTLASTPALVSRRDLVARCH